MSDLADEMIDGPSEFLASVRANPDGWTEDDDLPIRDMAKKGPFSALVEHGYGGGWRWHVYRDGVGLIGFGESATIGDVRAAIGETLEGRG